jgi:hypothetical protein
MKAGMYSFVSFFDAEMSAGLRGSERDMMRNGRIFCEICRCSEVYGSEVDGKLELAGKVRRR